MLPAALMVGPVGNSKHRKGSDARTLRRNSLSRNDTGRSAPDHRCSRGRGPGTILSPVRLNFLSRSEAAVVAVEYPVRQGRLSFRARSGVFDEGNRTEHLRLS